LAPFFAAIETFFFFSVGVFSAASEELPPAFGYDARHPDARGTSTLLNNVLLSTRRVAQA
jgi:hypothetical protein